LHQILERSDFRESWDRSPVFSVYRITTDGQTPFTEETKSEILYDENGQPDEVVVYLDGGDDELAMATSESRDDPRLANHRLPGSKMPGKSSGERSPGNVGGPLRPSLPASGGYIRRRDIGVVSGRDSASYSYPVYSNDDENMEYDDGPFPDPSALPSPSLPAPPPVYYTSTRDIEQPPIKRVDVLSERDYQ
jgi:hypothetical protein